MPERPVVEPRTQKLRRRHGGLVRIQIEPGVNYPDAEGSRCRVLPEGLVCGSSRNALGDAGIPIWIMLLCSATMGIGTSVGGERIIKSVGQSMVKLEKYQGFSADLAGAANLLLATLTGIPVSSTHIKTCAIMGVGAVKRLSAINFGVVKDMMFTWFFTFPACGLISFVMAKLFMMFL